MNCRDATRFLDAYADDELDLANAVALEQHLTSCPRCRAIERNLRALRTAVHAHTAIERAPRRLRERLADRFTAPAREAPRGARRAWMLGAFALGGLAMLGLILALEPMLKAAPSTPRIVYHINNSDTAAAALRTLGNHLEAAPNVKVVVVAHNAGVDFLLQGARDESGQLYAAEVRRFRERGVDFRVCQNTLTRRKIETRALIPEAELVPSGIAEIGRLQSQEGFVYTRL